MLGVEQRVQVSSVTQSCPTLRDPMEQRVSFVVKTVGCNIGTWVRETDHEATSILLARQK